MSSRSDSRFDASWARLWAGLGASGDGALLREDLLQRHAQPWRRYHTQQHLAECLAAFSPVANLAVHAAEVEAALWFHDAVYELRASDNEARSARLAEASLAGRGVAGDVIARIKDLVMATRHDTPAQEADALLLVDVDLAILGAEPPRFAEYERQIRDEYAFVPQALFVERRREILQGFLSRPRIYGTDHFHDRLEAQARVNLETAIRQVG